MAEVLKIEASRLEFILGYTVRLIQSGKVVAFPTDTFYGLGADPFNLSAVSEVYRIKGRASDRPLPLLVSSIEQAASLAYEPPPLFFTLAERFWPGALTLVVPASRMVPLKLTANTGKVGLRFPDWSFAVDLVTAVGSPLTGTSANYSDKPACATAQEVYDQLGEALPLILDGGPTPAQLASTVVEIHGDTCRLLRPGKIPASELSEFLSPGHTAGGA